MLPTNSIFKVDQHYESLTKHFRFASLAQRLLFFSIYLPHKNAYSTFHLLSFDANQQSSLSFVFNEET